MIIFSIMKRLTLQLACHREAYQSKKALTWCICAPPSLPTHSSWPLHRFANLHHAFSLNLQHAEC